MTLERGAIALSERPLAPRVLARGGRGPVIVGVALWLLMAAAVLLTARGVLMVDIKPEVYLAPWRTFRSFLSPWQADPQLGFPSFNVGLAPVAGLVGLLQSAGLSPELSARVLRLALLTVGALGAARLFRTLSGARGPAAGWGATAAATAYVANPYTVVAGATLPVQWPWAVLPWLLWALVRAVETGRGWRWPAAVALLFAATTGMNAGVIALIQLVSAPVLVGYAAVRAGTSWRGVGAVLLRCTALVVLLSLYWLVPTLSGLGAGETVVDNSETLDGIAATSSMAEVLRGLGLWPLYGRDASGPWVPEHVGYLLHAWLLVASFGFTVLVGVAAAVARGRARLAAVLGLAVTALLMVGLHPVDHPSPLGRALGWAFVHVPGLAAFRTTNKAGASLTLMAALLVGLAVARTVQRAPAGRLPRRSVAVAGAATLGVLLASAAPGLSGNLFTSPVEIPAYWKAAAADLDSGPADRRVWLVPGEVSAAYRWTPDRPDDLGNSLLTRPALVRTVIPVTAPVAANLLAAADTQLQEGWLPPAGLSTYARYLGVGDVLLRNDVVWEKTAGARPSALQRVVNGDPGLQPVGNYGAPGENVLPPDIAPSPPWEGALPPLQRWSVPGATPTVRAHATAGTVLLSGDGYAVSAAQDAGLLPDGAGFRYLQDVPAGELSALLGAEHRVVLTDTNRRRTTVAGRLVGAQGPLLGAHTDPGPSRALGTAGDQTVLLTEGGAARATQVGSAFGTLPQAAPENAVDGDPATSWQFGDFRRAVGASLVVSLPGPRRIGRVVVQAAPLGRVGISRVRVAAGGRSRVAPVGGDGAATAHLGGVRASSLRVTVTGLRGDGFNRLGISEVHVPGVRLTRVARLPETLARLAREGDVPGDVLRRTPVDVVLTRVATTPDDARDDEETGLERVLDLPDARDFRVYGVLRAQGSVPEADLDRLSGATGRVTATSTSHAFDLPGVRASAALDGDPGTAWVPGKDAVGESLTVAAPPRRVDHVTVVQGGGDDHTHATRARVELDGQVVADSPLRAHRTRIAFPPRSAATLRLTLLGRSGSGLVRIAEVGFGAAKVRPEAGRAGTACVRVASLDGHELDVHPLAPVTGQGPLLFQGCGGTTSLGAGRHRLSAVPGWTLDRLVLRDHQGEVVQPPGPAPRLTVDSPRPTSYRITSASSTAPWTLVLGQAFDARWHAEVDGIDLGPPEVVDGYSAGWTIDKPGPHVIDVRYGPERSAFVALVLSGAGLLLAGSLVLAPFVAPGGPAPVAPAGAPEGPRAGARARAARRPSRRLGWVVTVALALLAGGWWLALAAVALAAWDLVRRPAPTTLIGAGVGCWAALPLVWYAGNSARWGEVSPRLVAGNPWPHVVAFVGLLLVVAGVVRHELEDRSGRLARRE